MDIVGSTDCHKIIRFMQKQKDKLNHTCLGLWDSVQLLLFFSKPALVLEVAAREREPLKHAEQEIEPKVL